MYTNQPHCKVRTSRYLVSLGCQKSMSLVTGRPVKGLHKLGACFQLLACIISLNLQCSQLTGELTDLLRGDTLSANSQGQARSGCAACICLPGLWQLVTELSCKQTTQQRV